MITATFTIDQHLDLDLGYRYTASWVGQVRVDSGWHLDLDDAWHALTVALRPRLARTGDRAVTGD